MNKMDYYKALECICGHFSVLNYGGGGVKSSNSDPIAPQDVAGVALFLKDGRVAVLGGGAND